VLLPSTFYKKIIRKECSNDNDVMLWLWITVYGDLGSMCVLGEYFDKMGTFLWQNSVNPGWLVMIYDPLLGHFSILRSGGFGPILGCGSTKVRKRFFLSITGTGTPPCITLPIHVHDNPPTAYRPRDFALCEWSKFHYCFYIFDHSYRENDLY